MGKLGMMGIYFPTSVGGAGGDVLSYVMAVEELSKVSAPPVSSFLLTPACALLLFMRMVPRSRRQSTCPSSAAASGWALSA